jgi:hypothetical protein
MLPIKVAIRRAIAASGESPSLPNEIVITLKKTSAKTSGRVIIIGSSSPRQPTMLYYRTN